MGQKILVVDDDAQIRGLLKIFLEQKGYTVMTSGNGWDCLKDIAQYDPDLLILDIRMPKIDGIAVLDMLKVGGLLKDDIPVLLCTGVQDSDTILTAAKLQTDEFVVKPFDLEDLAARIAKHLYRPTFEEFQALVPLLREVDETYFHPAKLPLAQGTAKSYKYYLAASEGREIGIALSRTLQPADILELSEDKIAREAVVFLKLTRHWKRVWPSTPNR